MSVSSVKTMDAHVGGAALRLIVDGLPALPGRTLAEQTEALGDERSLARAVLREPRGHADMLGAVLTEPESPGAAAGVVFLTGTDESPLLPSHGIIGVTTLALERRLLTLADPRSFVIDTLAGPVEVEPRLAHVAGGLRIDEVEFRTPPVFIAEGACPVRLDGRVVHVDIVWATGYYVIADREALAVAAESGPQASLRRAVARLIDALDSRRSRWPSPSGTQAPIQGVVLTGPPVHADADLRSTVVYANGVVDRSPSGGGTASVLAVLDAMGMISETRPLHHEGPAGLVFKAFIANRLDGEGGQRIVPAIIGQAWSTGDHEFLFDDRDPLARGFDP
jgi:proline racemase